MLGWILYLRKITAELIEGGNSQNAYFVTTIEPVSPAKGHLSAMTSSDTPWLSTRPRVA
jgi:hypothetical protein